MKMTTGVVVAGLIFCVAVTCPVTGGARAPDGKTARTRLRLRVDRLAAGDQVTVTLNGQTQGVADPVDALVAEPADHWLEIGPDPELVKPGENLAELELTSTRVLSEPLVVSRLVLFASYH